MNKLTPAELAAHLASMTPKVFLAECEAMKIQDAQEDEGDNLVAIWATKLTGIACEAFLITRTIEAAYSRDSFNPIVQPCWLNEILESQLDGELPEFSSAVLASC